MIETERIQVMKDGLQEDGQYVLYWMQQAQRVRYNHALMYAIHRANELNVPVVVVFGLTDDFPEANERHYAFMLEGLRDVAIALKKRKIRFVLKHQSPDVAALSLAKDAALVVMDRGYLKIQKVWRSRVVADAPCGVVQVETDVVVPVDVVTDKEEYAARTIRPKIHNVLEDYWVPLDDVQVKQPSLKMMTETIPSTPNSAIDTDAKLACLFRPAYRLACQYISTNRTENATPIQILIVRITYKQTLRQWVLDI
ncbi:MAG: deoxyribodipyrimidine photo-lyase [Candidatus Latescibacterota bacterium]